LTFYLGCYVFKFSWEVHVTFIDFERAVYLSRSILETRQTKFKCKGCALAAVVYASGSQPGVHAHSGPQHF